MHDYLLQVAREGLLLVLVLSAIPVGTALFIGLFLSVLQATTQLQEQTLTFAPKLLAVSLSLIIAGPWIGAQLLRFTQLVLEGIPYVF